ncbi:MAG TPA: hypothetical protein PK472_13860, partial [Pseudomonadota bacterium]|nr:hypothetical protein [Pseudomonadota bacterium]
HHAGKELHHFDERLHPIVDLGFTAERFPFRAEPVGRIKGTDELFVVERLGARSPRQIGRSVLPLPDFPASQFGR